MADPNYDALLDNLRALTSAQDNAEFTRPNLIAVLEIVTAHLDDALALNVGKLEDGMHVEAEHPVATLLSGLVSALRDLNNGLTDPVLTPTSGKKNSARRWRLRQEDAALFEALEIFQRIKGLPCPSMAGMQGSISLA